jgi:hypothetical protein
MYKLTQLIHEPDTDRVFIEVTYKGFPIQKWYDPSVDGHASDIAKFKSKDLNGIQAIVNDLGNELKQALKHPDVRILDENDNVIPRNENLNRPQKTDLKKELGL